MTGYNIREIINRLETDWKDILINILDHNPKIEEEISKGLNQSSKIPIYPPKNLIFNAFDHFNIKDLKVVIIGQDPYHNPGEAMGLSFSVPEGCKMPPSLRNIFKELNREFRKERECTDLTDWAKQGVLLLNASLTVYKNLPESHMEYWGDFTEEIVKYISKNCKEIVWMHWGNFAKSYSKFVDNKENLLLEWTHPSPLSRKTFDCNHFVECNQYLKKCGKEDVKWV